MWKHLLWCRWGSAEMILRFQCIYSAFVALWCNILEVVCASQQTIQSNRDWIKPSFDISNRTRVATDTTDVRVLPSAIAPRTRMPDSFITQSGWKSRPFRSGRRWGSSSSRNTLASTSSAAAEHFPASTKEKPNYNLHVQPTEEHKDWRWNAMDTRWIQTYIIDKNSLQNVSRMPLHRFWKVLNCTSPSLTQVPVR